MKSLSVFILLFIQLQAKSQSTEDSLHVVINRFFECMQKNDIRGFDQIMNSTSELKTVIQFKDSVMVHSMKYSEFQSMMNEPIHGTWEEKMTRFRFLQDELMATVWTDYEFYLDEKLRHTGVNQFTLMRDKSDNPYGWKIISIIDTRYPGGKGDVSATEEIQSINKLINQKTNDWHLAATSANEKEFFNVMSDSCIYKGTDKTERWTKSEFYAFAKPFFDKGKAWDFKPLERNIRVNENLDMVVFDERLDTWMGECKATGVWKKENGKWKLWHYDLSVTIDNDKIKKFIELING